jgi:DNA-binding response OmpR family regulator
MTEQGMDDLVTTGQKKNILIVDDDRDIGDLLQKILAEQTDYNVLWLAESELALDTLAFMRPSLLILDYLMPEMNGLTLYYRLQEMEGMRGIPIIFISASIMFPFEELNQPGVYVIKKPFELDELLDTVAQLLA